MLFEKGNGVDIRFSPDGRFILGSNCRAKAATLWNGTTGAKIREFSGHDDIVWRVAFGPEGKTAFAQEVRKN